MPDVARSDSQRSDTSLKPRVSFNRDVHVKRIVPRENITGTLNGDGANHISPVRKERIKKSKKELEDEAAQVIYQRNKIDRGGVPEKYYTLPSRHKSNQTNNNYLNASLDRKTKRRSSVDLVNNIAPKKPPRTFTTTVNKPQQKSSIFDLFKKSNKKSDTKKSNLRRTVSDVSNLKLKRDNLQNHERNYHKQYGSDSEENLNNTRRKNKKLSPIVEITPREDYFAEVNGDDNENDKENNSNNDNIKTTNHNNNTESVTKKLKEYIDEVDDALYKETGIRPSPVEDKTKKKIEVVLIDVDKAEKISNNNSKKSKLKKNTINRIKSISKKNKDNNKKTNNDLKDKYKDKSKLLHAKHALVEESKKLDEKLSSPAPRIKQTIDNLENPPKNSPKMIHSSQKPVEKLPLTKGRTVDNIVKRLSNDSSSPPPMTNLLISPSISVQHNNNQPFSYTRGLSPEKCTSNENLPNPIIYAQVVCANGSSGPSKQTVHTAYTNGRKQPHSDSDEGLGYEENLSGNTRKYESETNNKSITYFGDNHFNSSSRQSENKSSYGYSSNDFTDKFQDGRGGVEESPIMPKFTNPNYSKGYFDYSRRYDEIVKTVEENNFVDTSYRGRGDGMDSKRRESLSEFDNDFDQFDGVNKMVNGRSDLSARRDLLESRMNRRLNDKINNYPNASSTPTKLYNYESHQRIINEERRSMSPKNRYNKHEFISNSYDNEPKSFDSQLSDYRSSPENKHFETSQSTNKYKRDTQKMFKNRDMYKSTPEIHHNRNYDEQQIYFKDSYHDSLRREKTDNRIKSFIKYKNEHYIDHNERKDKFGDSGIENDIRRDSGEQRQTTKSRRDYFNDSEDEGFASSLLIASERQHTEDNINRIKNHQQDYDSDRPYSREDDPYNHQLERMDYKRFEYAPRERSIDDGSHFDPRIDSKEFDKNKGALKKVEKKPPKPEKKRGLDKVKQLFSRDTKKKKEKQGMVPEENLRARYTEYKGSQENLEPKMKAVETNELHRNYDYSNRKRLPTPSPSPTREIQANRKKSEVSHSWFKSLDRLSRKNPKKNVKETTRPTSEEPFTKSNPPPKNLRFFGDTDIESNDSVRQKSKSRPSVVNRERIKSQSSRDLHNISEEFSSPELKGRRTNYKSMMNILETEKHSNKNSKSNMKPPISPITKNNPDNSRNRDERGRRRKNEVSSVESSTEGDSSQQSQRSVVYLHAATVGDIPGPTHLRNGRRAASREELISNSSNRIQPQVKTLSRSFSVLAPWRPRHYRDEIDIDYTHYPKPIKNGKYEQKAVKNSSSRKENVSTLKKKAQETRRSNQNMSTLSRKSRSKENISSSTLKRSRDDLAKDSTSTLYKKKDKLPRENSRYNKDRDDKRMSSKCLSVEYLGGTNGRPSRKSKEQSRDISRSVSMPKDPEKSAGWFKMNKKNKKSISTQRL